MAHHVYNTEGLILTSRPAGEANKIYTIYTEEVGMVHATAQSVRALKSKLRYSLTNHTLVRVALVRGREVWRLTGAETVPCLEAWPLARRRQFMAELSQILDTLIQGEERNTELFAEIKSALNFLDQPGSPEEIIENARLILFLRIMSNLGYHKPEPELKPFYQSVQWSLELVSAFTPHQAQARRSLEESFGASHL
jgi:DNA repair protein RecO